MQFQRICPNCDTELVGPYCYECGQKEPERITWLTFGNRFFERYLDIEHGMPHTFWQLLTKPGETTRAYLEGKRASYSDPVKYALITISIVVIFLLNTDTMLDFIEGMQDGMRGEQARGTTNSQKIMHDVNNMFLQYMQIWMAGFVPLFAFFAWLFFKRSKLNLAEHFVFQCFVYGTQNIATFPCWILMWLLPSESGYFLGVSMMIYIGYLFYAFADFYRGNTATTIFKALATYVVSYIVFMIILMLAFGTYIVYMIKTKKLDPKEFAEESKKNMKIKSRKKGSKSSSDSTKKRAFATELLPRTDYVISAETIQMS